MEEHPEIFVRVGKAIRQALGDDVLDEEQEIQQQPMPEFSEEEIMALEEQLKSQKPELPVPDYETFDAPQLPEMAGPPPQELINNAGAAITEQEMMMMDQQRAPQSVPIQPPPAPEPINFLDIIKPKELGVEQMVAQKLNGQELPMMNQDVVLDPLSKQVSRESIKKDKSLSVIEKARILNMINREDVISGDMISGIKQRLNGVS